MTNQTIIEQVRDDFNHWNTLKQREVEAGIVTEEKYQELKKESLRVLKLQIAKLEGEI